MVQVKRLTCTLKVLKEETKVTASLTCLKTADIIDAICAIRHWSFLKGEAFGTAERYQHLLWNDVPAVTEIINFCFDQYSGPSLKS